VPLEAPAPALRVWTCASCLIVNWRWT